MRNYSSIEKCLLHQVRNNHYGQKFDVEETKGGTDLWMIPKAPPIWDRLVFLKKKIYPNTNEINRYLSSYPKSTTNLTHYKQLNPMKMKRLLINPSAQFILLKPDLWLSFFFWSIFIIVLVFLGLSIQLNNNLLRKGKNLSSPDFYKKYKLNRNFLIFLNFVLYFSCAFLVILISLFFFESYLKPYFLEISPPILKTFKYLIPFVFIILLATGYGIVGSTFKKNKNVYRFVIIFPSVLLLLVVVLIGIIFYKDIDKKNSS